MKKWTTKAQISCIDPGALAQIIVKLTHPVLTWILPTSPGSLLSPITPPRSWLALAAPQPLPALARCMSAPPPQSGKKKGLDLKTGRPWSFVHVSHLLQLLKLFLSFFLFTILIAVAVIALVRTNTSTSTVGYPEPSPPSSTQKTIRT